MPTYAYACTECGHQFDAVQSFADAALTECPQCSGRLRKQYGSIGVTFSGSGFYRTDSRSEKRAATGNSPGSTAESKSESSTSTTPAPAAAPASS